MTQSRDADHAPVVATAYGRLRGRRRADGLCLFLGVPYGAPTGGADRFRPPRRPHPWTGIRDAQEEGPLTPQWVPEAGVYSGDVEETQQLIGGAMPRFERVRQGEDCLVLNLWTPAVADGGRRPVMVHCHGGGFIGGSGLTDWTDGGNLAARNDAVVVAMNHRLNIFGHLHLGDIPGAAEQGYAESGNAGLLDLVAALQWVHDNIAAFGGDPGNVTLFGESGGGSKISCLLAMPAARGLFHKAIIESGPMLKALSRDQATATTERALAALDIGPDSLTQLATLPVERLLGAMAAVLQPDNFGWEPVSWYRHFAPVQDGHVLPRHPFDPDAPAISADIPVLIGCTAEETRLLFGGGDASLFSLDDAGLRSRLGRLVPGIDPGPLIEVYAAGRPDATATDLFFAITSDLTFRFDAVTKAERIAAAGGAPVYMYLFTWRSPAFGGKWGSGHGTHLPFVFDTLDQAQVQSGTDPRRHALAQAISGAWAAFARSGSPDHAGLPNWAPYDPLRRATMILDHDCVLVDDPGRAERLAVAGLLAGQ